MDPSLSIRYRKKNRDKDNEPERIEKRSSTPEYKIDKRRGSKVSVSSFCSYILVCLLCTLHFLYCIIGGQNFIWNVGYTVGVISVYLPKKILNNIR